MRVLYIEDDLISVAIAKKTYVRVCIVSEPRLADAMARLALESFDVLLVDLNLPDSKGIDTVRALVEFDTPIVVLTGDDSSEFHAEAWKLGVADYISKRDLLDTDVEAKLEAAHDNYQRIKRRYSSISFGNIEQMKPYITCPPFASLCV